MLVPKRPGYIATCSARKAQFRKRCACSRSKASLLVLGLLLVLRPRVRLLLRQLRLRQICRCCLYAVQQLFFKVLIKHIVLFALDCTNRLMLLTSIWWSVATYSATNRTIDRTTHKTKLVHELGDACHLYLDVCAAFFFLVLSIASEFHFSSSVADLTCNKQQWRTQASS